MPRIRTHTRKLGHYPTPKSPLWFRPDSDESQVFKNWQGDRLNFENRDGDSVRGETQRRDLQSERSVEFADDYDDEGYALWRGEPHAQGSVEGCGTQTNAPDTGEVGVFRFVQEKVRRFPAFSWCENLRSVADLAGRPDIPQPLIRGGDNGVPRWVDRIKCLGNAVVPQVAQVIGEAILQNEMNTS